MTTRLHPIGVTEPQPVVFADENAGFERDEIWTEAQGGGLPQSVAQLAIGSELSRGHTPGDPGTATPNGHLGQTGESHDPEKRDRAYYVRQYETRFAPLVRAEVAHLKTLPKRERQEHKGVLQVMNRGGAVATPFAFELDGKRYVLKLPHDNDAAVAASEGRWVPLERGKDIPAVEKPAALSESDGLVIVEHMPGPNLRQATVDEIRRITKERLANTFEIMSDMHKVGMMPDWGAPEHYIIMRDSQKYFGLIDCVALGPNSTETAVEMIARFGFNLRALGSHPADGIHSGVPEARREVLEIFRLVCAARLGDDNDYRQAMRFVEPELRDQ